MDDVTWQISENIAAYLNDCIQNKESLMFK